MTDDWLEASRVPDGVSCRPGSYVLEFELDRALTVCPGRLDPVEIPSGLVRYYGSAWGPGGLKGRVGRHLRLSIKRRWHVDALTLHVRPRRTRIVVGGRECVLVAGDLETGQWTAPVPGFGATDCRTCPSHLLHHRLGGAGLEGPRS